MIEAIIISNIAAFGSVAEKLDGLSQFNYIFGANGTGKTTISRIIANEEEYPTCTVYWRDGIELQPLVYNHDFIEKNFEQSTELKGIFTLGEKDVETAKKINETKGEIDKLNQRVRGLLNTLQGEDGSGGKKGELASLEAEFKSKCWKQKQKYDDIFWKAFSGYRNSSEKFQSKILEEAESNTATLKELGYLETRAKTVFGETPISESRISPIQRGAIPSHENNPILKKHVIGKDDVDIAAMIKKLGNSDWVRAGIKYYDENDMYCPFCQQPTTEAFARSLREFFDEAFEADTKAIDDLLTNYKKDTERLRRHLDSIITNPSRFLDVEKLKAEKQILESKVLFNIQQLELKKKEPSQVVALESLDDTISAIEDVINIANVNIIEHNKIVEDITREHLDLTKQVWKYLLEVELKDDIVRYRKKKTELIKAISSIENKLKKITNDIKNKESELRKLEKEATSIQPTIDGINGILVSFGFQGFMLAKSEEGNTYRLIRPNGEDVKNTLSEGEKNFISFLYFYHLLKGSDSESGIATDRVVVFDDPVSSLDSDILFVVSSLIKSLFDEVRNGIGNIKQIFILTHNVYFHREVTFYPNRRDKAMKEETFWVIRKSGLVSKIERHESNPIKTSYELLWAEVQNPNRSNHAIQNTMRRIIENYYKILGQVDPDDICSMFEGKDKQICKSLFSWVNAGSHYALDDLYLSIDKTAVETYLKVFKDIFEKTGHSAHYRMMMGEERWNVSEEVTE